MQTLSATPQTTGPPIQVVVAVVVVSVAKAVAASMYATPGGWLRRS